MDPTPTATFRDHVGWSIFDDTFPLCWSSEDHASFWAVPRGENAGALRALGKVFRAGGWTAEHTAEFDRVMGAGSFEKYQARSKAKSAAKSNGQIWMGG